MRTWVDKQIDRLSHNYVRHGGKDNRRKQIRQLKNACNWIAEKHHVNSLEQIGRRQIGSFYEFHRYLSYATLKGHYYAFSLLWTWLNRPGEPPRPFNINKASCQTTNNDKDHN